MTKLFTNVNKVNCNIHNELKKAQKIKKKKKAQYKNDIMPKCHKK